ncbi:MAG TPA: hypothetical protein VJK03_04480 [Candidatus Nanoarchaeia archaeon]|nr:hypothetical protein [Candidatus Nanoarchaeia archaeon]
MYKRNRRSAREQAPSCSCGSPMRSRTRRNYPFGQNSVARTVRFFLCPTCHERK